MCYLGCELEQAIIGLEKEGYTVALTEVRSKKGIEDGDTKKVVRQRLTGEKSVELCYSLVLCHVEEMQA